MVSVHDAGAAAEHGKPGKGVERCSSWPALWQCPKQDSSLDFMCAKGFGDDKWNTVCTSQTQSCLVEAIFFYSVHINHINRLPGLEFPRVTTTTPASKTESGGSESKVRLYKVNFLYFILCCCFRQHTFFLHRQTKADVQLEICF